MAKKTGGKKKDKAAVAKEKAAEAAGAAAGAAAQAADKSIQSFRDAFDRSIALSRERIQEVVDDAVGRGRMKADDANELVSRLVTRGRRYSDELLRDLENLIEKLRQRATVNGSEPAEGEFPIPGYDELKAADVRTKLDGLDRGQLAAVREREASGKARKTVLAEVDRRLGSD